MKCIPICTPCECCVCCVNADILEILQCCPRCDTKPFPFRSSHSQLAGVNFVPHFPAVQLQLPVL